MDKPEPRFDKEINKKFGAVAKVGAITSLCSHLVTSHGMFGSSVYDEVFIFATC